MRSPQKPIGRGKKMAIVDKLSLRVRTFLKQMCLVLVIGLSILVFVSLFTVCSTVR